MPIYLQSISGGEDMTSSGKPDSNIRSSVPPKSVICPLTATGTSQDVERDKTCGYFTLPQAKRMLEVSDSGVSSAPVFQKSNLSAKIRKYTTYDLFANGKLPPPTFGCTRFATVAFQPTILKTPHTLRLPPRVISAP